MKKIIIPLSYMGSGSSAVTDLVSEFENVNNKFGSFEYVFLHCPNGVFDLEDKLLTGNNALRSDEALHQFLKTMKNLFDKKYYWVGNYNKIISPNFYQRCIQYVDELTDFKLDNYWYIQENTNLIMGFKLAIRKVLYYISFKKINLKKPLLYKTMYLSYPNEIKFYQISKKFINDVFAMIDNGDDDLLLDQLLLPHNLFRAENYFDDNVKMIVVDRDPRDVFISNKYNWGLENCGVPYSYDVKTFCEQYKKIRLTEKKYNNKNVLKIHFEDLIYNYEKTLKKIIEFLGYENKKHILKKQRFNPDKSIVNTQLFNNEKYLEESKYIAKELKEYLYNFPYKYEKSDEDKIF